MSKRRPACYVSPRLGSTVATLLSCLMVVGCGDGKVPRYPVRGTVLVDGKPYEGLRVTFVPVVDSEELGKKRPRGVTDESGVFALSTFRKDDGAPAGEYKVMFRNGKPFSKEQAVRWKGRAPVKADYGFPDRSGVTAVVEASDNDLGPFELESSRGRR